MIREEEAERFFLPGQLLAVEHGRYNRQGGLLRDTHVATEQALLTEASRLLRLLARCQRPIDAGQDSLAGAKRIHRSALGQRFEHTLSYSPQI